MCTSRSAHVQTFCLRRVWKAGQDLVPFYLLFVPMGGARPVLTLSPPAGSKGDGNIFPLPPTFLTTGGPTELAISFNKATSVILEDTGVAMPTQLKNEGEEQGTSKHHPYYIRT